ncbi:nuclear transport factor 2 family protein [Nocardioides sp. zg-536]|uniref:Nuclear transport factor 2 family protein n=1 Tax=Nocardioides faecalis TaxID=2803858 RepID=A0A939BU05_9ACTN|nr:nuclear transport factor 2 family protein [Nocardioides faecalis]MBM9458336.1 nuclear transport factor 2 family protein [Nocardioides faecalis]MBS4753363.1 nuclear transport factor 2 family protein [Nocardioides faecalis]QVI58361.1 nuclear transport factor 2 family protein [Nocardioides faecalis]
MPTALPAGLDPVDALLALEEIKRVFAARLRVMDTKQWHLYAGLHTADVVSETWGGLPLDKQPRTDAESNRVVGNEALAETIRRFLDGPIPVTSVHHGHTPEIELTSATTARGVWAMEDHLWWSDEDGEYHLHGYGHYHEEYRREDGRWLISYRSLTRLRVDAPADFFRFSEVL